MGFSKEKLHLPARNSGRVQNILTLSHPQLPEAHTTVPPILRVARIGPLMYTHRVRGIRRGAHVARGTCIRWGYVHGVAPFPDTVLDRAEAVTAIEPVVSSTATTPGPAKRCGVAR